MSKTFNQLNEAYDRIRDAYEELRLRGRIRDEEEDEDE